MESKKDELVKLIQQKAKDGSIDDLLKEIQKRIDLTFEPNPTSNPNLCLKDAEEVRDEFRTTFSLQDLTHYLLALGINNINFNFEEIPLPKDTVIFWELVRKGK